MTPDTVATTPQNGALTQRDARGGLVLEDVTVQRSTFDIVRKASLVAPIGEVTVVLGANGAGKTTLLELGEELEGLADRPAAVGGDLEVLLGGQLGKDTPALLDVPEPKARALAVRPKVLMIDEMSLGLAPLIASRLIAMVRTLADERGVGVLLVEQFAALALAAGDHAYVISQGTIVYDGSPAPLIEHPDILQRAYLGEVQ